MVCHFSRDGRIPGEDRDRLNLQVAELFELTPNGHYEETDSPFFVNNRANYGREHLPHPILGAMCLKVLREENPCSPSGPYSDQDLDFFWSHVEHKLDSLPSDLHSAIRQRTAFPQAMERCDAGGRSGQGVHAHGAAAGQGVLWSAAQHAVPRSGC